MRETTDPILRSFIEVPPESHFPIQNLPFGVLGTRSDASPRAGLAIGDWVLDLAVLERYGWFGLPALRNASRAADETFFDQPSLNSFMALGRGAAREVRDRLSTLLRHDEPTLRDNAALRQEALVPMGK